MCACLVTEYVTLSFDVNGSRNATAVGVFESYLGQRVHENREFGFRSDITESMDVCRNLFIFLIVHIL